MMMVMRELIALGRLPPSCAVLSVTCGACFRTQKHARGSGGASRRPVIAAATAAAADAVCAMHKPTAICYIAGDARLLAVATVAAAVRLACTALFHAH